MPVRRSDRRTLGLRLALEREDDINTLVARVVYEATAADVYNPEDVGAIFTPSFLDHITHEAKDYDGFRAAAGWSADLGFYGVRHEYHNVTRVGTEQAKAMARVMAKVDAALAERQTRDGYTEDFAVYALRVAEAIGATFFVHRPHERRPLVRIGPEEVPAVVKALIPAA